MINIYTLNADTCYSIQIWSQKGAVDSMQKKIPNSCKLYDIGGYTTSRCGCFAEIDDAQKVLNRYKKLYPTAYITKIAQDNILKKHLGFGSRDSLSYAKELDRNFIQLDSKDSTIYGLTIEGKYEEFENRDYKEDDEQDVAIRNYVDYQHYIKLNFALFKDGFFEYRSKGRLERKSNKLFYLKNLSTVMKNSFSDMKIFFKKLNNQIEYRYYRELTKLYHESMKEYKNRYDNSMIERYKYSLIDQTYQRYTKYSKIYKIHKRLNVTKDIYRLMRSVDHLPLKSIDHIVDYALDHSSATKLVEAKNSILDESKSYLDTIEVDIYAKRNSIDEVGSYDTLGIEAKFPLDMSSSEEQRVARLKQHSNDIVDKSFKKSIRERISYLYITFTDMQKFVDIDRADIIYFKSRIDEFKKLKKDMIDGIYIDPDREILRASHKIIDLKFNILRTKVKLMAILYEIAYISGIEDISKLVKSESIR